MDGRDTNAGHLITTAESAKGIHRLSRVEDLHRNDGWSEICSWRRDIADGIPVWRWEEAVPQRRTCLNPLLDTRILTSVSHGDFGCGLKPIRKPQETNLILGMHVL